MEFLRSIPKDYAIFAAIVLGLVALAHILFWRGLGRRRFIPTIAWLLAIATVACAWWVVDEAGKKEQARLKEMVEGFAPTYAAELQRMGHAQITPETAPDDPIYLELIEAEKRWLRVNQSVNDIYTFRKNESVFTLIVDSETDYDRNGRFEGDREQRTAIAETYDTPIPALEEAFREARYTFNPEPVTDRWGTWVSAYAPMFDRAGKLEAVLGVDFDARSWESSKQRARLTAMSYLGLFVLSIVCVSTAGVSALIREEGDRKKQSARMEQDARIKFESLVHSIQGIVFECPPNRIAFHFVSRQAEHILGYTHKQLTEEGFWSEKLHPDDKDWAINEIKRAGEQGRPYRCEYRMIAADGRVVWIREHGGSSRQGDDRRVMRGVMSDITLEKQHASELESANKQLVEASRQAGMAEIASGVLHNVGNVLNSVNVSSTLIQDQLAKSRVGNLGKLAGLLREQGANLANFMTHDERGKMIPSYLEQLNKVLIEEHGALVQEIAGLARNLEHIKDIVVMQQAYAKVSGRIEKVDLKGMAEDALQINSASFMRHRVRVLKEFQDVPEVLVDRNKVLQILVNLIRNAKHALDDSQAEDRVLKVSLARIDEDNVAVEVIDNGIGIPPENMARIFNHGFTTKSSGHGFGLHISALTAKEMGGSLKAFSEGSNKGASFVLQLPIRRREAPDVPSEPEITEAPPTAHTTPFQIASQEHAA